MSATQDRIIDHELGKINWEKRVNQLEEFFKDPKVLDLKPVNSVFIVPADFVGDYHKLDNGTILAVSDSIKDQAWMESALRPKLIVAIDQQLKKNISINELDYVLLDRDAVPEGEIVYEGMNFIIYGWHSVKAIVPDPEKFNRIEIKRK